MDEKERILNNILFVRPTLIKRKLKNKYFKRNEFFLVGCSVAKPEPVGAEFFNPNQRGMPASTKEGALEEKIQLAEGGAGFSRQKRWTLRALLKGQQHEKSCSTDALG